MANSFNMHILQHKLHKGCMVITMQELHLVLSSKFRQIVCFNEQRDNTSGFIGCWAHNIADPKQTNMKVIPYL